MKIRNPNVQRIIDSHIREWFIREEQERPRPHKPLILISRQRGVGGMEVARRLSERLGWPYYGKNIIQEIAKALKTDPARMEILDEKERSILLEYTNVFVKDPNTSQEEYVLYLRRFIKKLGEVGGAIIVGRGANFVIPPERALRVRLVGRPKGWERYLKEKYGIPEEEAERTLKEWDREQREFIRRFFKEEIDEPRHYDMILNMGTYDWDGAVGLILEAYRRKFPQILL